MNAPWLNVNTYLPSHYDRGPNALVWLALIGLFTATFIKLWTPTSLNRWPEVIYTLLFIYPLVKHWHWLKQQRLMQMFGIALLAPFIFYGINLLIDADQARQFFEYEKLPRIYLVVPIAWWLGAHPRTIALFLATALAGFLFAIAQDPNLTQTLEQLFVGQRVDFNLLNAQHVSLFFGLALIGAASYLGGIARIHPTGLKLFTALGLLAIIVISGIGLYGTQTRAAWLALVIIGTVYVLKKSWILYKNSNRQNRPWIYSIISLLFIVSAAGLWQLKNPIAERFISETDTLTSLIKLDFQDIPYSSIGIRINTWIQAIEWIEQKPLIGYGAKVRNHIIKQSDQHPDWVKQAFGHFHNSYIELTLGFGMIGLAIALYPIAVAIKTSYQLNSTVADFALNGLVLFLLMNAFESYLFFWMGPYLLTLLVAPMLSQQFNQHYRIRPQP